MRWSWRYNFALVLSILGLCIILIFIFNKSFNYWSFELNPQLADEFGGFIGGLVGSLFSLAGIFLLFETLINQKNSFLKQQFESRYFELIKIYREIVSEMQHKIPNKVDKYESGKRIFIEIRRQFGEIFLIVKSYDNENAFDEIEKIDISYLILFFGMGGEYKEILKEFLNKYFEKSEEIMTKIFNACDSRKDKNNNFKEFGGHQSRLGHYFPHLYQTIKYVDDSESLSKKEKYDFIKILRAQLSVYELFILFINSLTDFGKDWRVKDNNDQNLITKYKLIKLLPPRFTFNIKPQVYYNVEFME